MLFNDIRIHIASLSEQVFGGGTIVYNGTSSYWV